MEGVPRQSAAITQRRGAQQRRIRLGWLSPYLWLLPATALFAVFRLYPIIYGLYLSVFLWDGIGPMEFNGLANYVQAVQDNVFQIALWHNFIYAAGTVIGKNVIALVLAVFLNGEIRGRTFFRTTLFMPVVMSFVVVGLLWGWVFNVQFGLMNSVLSTIGLGQWRSDWLGNPNLALISVMGVDLWKWYGFHMVVYLAGLQTLPFILYEAARIDGASAWQQFRHLTVPLVRPLIVVNVTLALMGGFNVFDLVYVMTEGGPNRATNVVMLYTYIQAFKFNHFGYASALSYVLLAIVTVISAIQIRLMSGEKYEL